MSSVRFVSPWLDDLPKRHRPSYARHRGHLDIDVAVIGGGLTGSAIAYSFSAAGIRIAVFEGGRIGEGGTASAGGFVLPEPVAEFQSLAALHGVRAARRIYRTSRRAALDFTATLRRLKIRCDLRPRQTIYFAATASAEKPLRKEAQARREAGLNAAWLTPRRLTSDTGIESPGGILTSGDAQLDPYRACLGLAKAAEERGALVFDRSPVRKVRAGRKAVEITTDGGTVRAGTVIVATGGPGPEFRSLRRHFTFGHTYHVLTEPIPAAVRRQVGRRAAVLRDTESPAHTIGWTTDDRILFGGADQPTVSSRLRDRVLVQRTGQLMYELSTLYPEVSGLQPANGWDAPLVATVDGVPFIGPHRNYPRHLFAFGFGRNGAGQAFLASRILLKTFLGETDPAHDIFAFARTLS